MEKEWAKFPRFSREYIDGLESFLDFAYTRGRPQGREIYVHALIVETVFGQEDMWFMII